MPTYDWNCEKCDKEIEIVKSIKEYTSDEHCPDCGNPMQRIFSHNVQFIGTAVQDAEYYHSLGTIVKNKHHRSELIRKHGLVEVGNEKPDRARYYMNRNRLEKIAKAYDDD